MKKLFILLLFLGIVTYGFGDLIISPISSEDSLDQIISFIETETDLKVTGTEETEENVWVLSFAPENGTPTVAEALESVIPSDSYDMVEEEDDVKIVLNSVNKGLELIYLLESAYDYLMASGDYESVMSVYEYIYELAVEKTGTQEYYDELLVDVENKMVAMNNPGIPEEEPESESGMEETSDETASSDDEELKEPEVVEQPKPTNGTQPKTAEISGGYDELYVIEIPFEKRSDYEVAMKKILKNDEKEELAKVLNSDDSIATNETLLLPVSLSETNDIYLYAYLIDKGDIIADISYLFYEDYKWKQFLDYNDIEILNKGKGDNTVYVIETGEYLNIPIKSENVISGADLLPLFGEMAYEVSEILVGIDKGLSDKASPPVEAEIKETPEKMEPAVTNKVETTSEPPAAPSTPGITEPAKPAPPSDEVTTEPAPAPTGSVEAPNEEVNTLLDQYETWVEEYATFLDSFDEENATDKQLEQHTVYLDRLTQWNSMFESLEMTTDQNARYVKISATIAD